MLQALTALGGLFFLHDLGAEAGLELAVFAADLGDLALHLLALAFQITQCIAAGLLTFE